MKPKTYPFTMEQLAAQFSHRAPQPGEKCGLKIAEDCSVGIVCKAWKARDAWACGQCARRWLMEIRGMTADNPRKLSGAQQRALVMLWRQGCDICRLKSDGSFYIQGPSYLGLYRPTVNALRQAGMIIEIKGELSVFRGTATAAYRLTPAGSALAEKINAERQGVNHDQLTP